MLVHIVRTLQKNIRDTDFVARYGGEEFAIIFPETYNSSAARVSERVRQAVEKERLSIRGHGRQKITISIGVAAYPANADTLADLVGKADKALYRAKQTGKNRVEVFTE
jgi:diguanylate cyclase (GGDEF)-like protein